MCAGRVATVTPSGQSSPGVKRFHHAVVRELTLAFEMMELAADPGLNLLTFTAEAGFESDEALNLLGSWAATVEQEQTAPTAGEA